MPAAKSTTEPSSWVAKRGTNPWMETALASTDTASSSRLLLLIAGELEGLLGWPQPAGMLGLLPRTCCMNIATLCWSPKNSSSSSTCAKDMALFDLNKTYQYSSIQDLGFEMSAANWWIAQVIVLWFNFVFLRYYSSGHIAALNKQYLWLIIYTSFTAFDSQRHRTIPPPTICTSPHAVTLKRMSFDHNLVLPWGHSGYLYPLPAVILVFLLGRIPLPGGKCGVWPVALVAATSICRIPQDGPPAGSIPLDQASAHQPEVELPVLLREDLPPLLHIYKTVWLRDSFQKSF